MSFKSYAVMGLLATAMTLLAVATAASVNSHPSAAGMLNKTGPQKVSGHQGGRKLLHVRGGGRPYKPALTNLARGY